MRAPHRSTLTVLFRRWGRLWFHQHLQRRPVRPDQAGYAVVEWWQGGHHELLAFSTTPHWPEKVVARREDPRRRMYSFNPPAGRSVIAVAHHHQFAAHASGVCDSLDCPAKSLVDVQLRLNRGLRR